MNPAEKEKEFAFIPKYSANHWWKLISTPALILVISGAVIVSSGRMGIDISAKWLLGLAGLFYVLEVLIFCTGEHIIKVQIHASGIVLHRPIGGRIEAAFGQMNQIANELVIEKRISLSLDDMKNRDELDSFLPKPILAEEARFHSEWRKFLENPMRHNAVVLLLLAGVIGVIGLWHILSQVQFPDWSMWIWVAGFAIADFIMAYNVIRNLAA